MKRITIKELSVKEIDKAIKEVEEYRKELKAKCILFCQKLSDIGVTTAKAKISESALGKYVTVTTEINPSKSGCEAIIIAIGASKQSDGYEPINTLLMIEFGVGIYHNSTPNPLTSEFGYGVGTFPGQKHAFEDGWFYPKGDGTWGFTHGVKATMPMYNADTDMMLNLSKVAKEVFK